MGFIKVANETMCRPIRALTQMKGYDAAAHALACFGGAGGQHACAIARSLGMKTIFIHRYSGILSAVGIGLADVVAEEQVWNASLGCIHTVLPQSGRAEIKSCTIHVGKSWVGDVRLVGTRSSARLLAVSELKPGSVLACRQSGCQDVTQALQDTEQSLLF